MEFFRQGCMRPRVFNESYVRCHHNQGLKPVRCFPHCSPECCPHSGSRGCGGSVSVRVATTDGVIAFARFESLSSDSVTTELEIDPRDVRSSANPTGVWLMGVRGRHDGVDCFHFNDQGRDGWHYEWQSSSSSKKRSQRHVFHVYLCHRLAAHRVRILDNLASTPFTIASYRRARAKQLSLSPSTSCSAPSTPPAQITRPWVVEYAELPRSSTQETAARLLQLFELCAQVPVTAVAPAIEARVWAEAARHVPGVRQPPALFLLRQLAPFDDAASRLETIALAVLCRLITSSSRIHDFCRRYDGSIYDNTELHEAYNRAVESLARSLDVVLATLGESTSSLSAQLPPPTVPQPSHAIGFAVFARILQTSHVARTQPLMPPDAVYGGVWAWRVATPIVRALQTPSFLDVLWSWLGACGLRLCLDGHVFSKHQVSRDDISMTRDRPVAVRPMNR
ncbi:hypothetical protein SDRG_09646 [Saprolegnia diclina VS20]|uniref:Uncharacterized protein n=1 Tax=Saprolegnia diclina (strain VS20) TaxID=1156394 RepID=T0QD54_SAPDV|nr:hypothetical protein SDRG_09646 [Saprolegnia diclina VS20]EQC32671.1 hypothetical protein SDRG_09646 [Saprolegnia diclina VS20]|eukprot:XP_008613815.1 hypothetical protein SDRG_09646 [Saprolegnia diclina VS20]